MSLGCSSGLTTALFIVFLVLKLTNIINWSWWWITAPLWIPFIIVVLIVIFFIWLKSKL